jgi:hypothetical protein
MLFVALCVNFYLQHCLCIVNIVESLVKKMTQISLAIHIVDTYNIMCP